jgi:alkylated DNA repair dioxygenase AlkB
MVGGMANTRSLQWQPSLLGGTDPPGFDASFTEARRIPLDEDAWVEHACGWVRGADALFAEVLARAPWTQRRVHMYDRMVDEPRLIAWYGTPLDDPSLPSVLAPMADALSERYGRRFDGVGAALYRDGRDSVAWHRDRIPLELVEPVVALISLGSRRTLRMRCRKTTAKRPDGSEARNRPGGVERHAETRAFTLLPGDLFVMGGTSQRTWEHSVPKVADAAPRLSLQFRHSR